MAEVVVVWLPDELLVWVPPVMVLPVMKVSVLPPVVVLVLGVEVLVLGVEVLVEGPVVAVVPPLVSVTSDAPMDARLRADSRRRPDGGDLGGGVLGLRAMAGRHPPPRLAKAVIATRAV